MCVVCWKGQRCFCVFVLRMIVIASWYHLNTKFKIFSQLSDTSRLGVTPWINYPVVNLIQAFSTNSCSHYIIQSISINQDIPYQGIITFITVLTLQCLEWCAYIVMYLKLEAKNLYSCTLHSYSRHWQSLHVGSVWFSFIFKKYFLPKDMKEMQYESFKLYSEEEENCCEEIT